MMKIITERGKMFVWDRPLDLPDVALSPIQEIWADFEELRIIKELFRETIPITTSAVVYWYGDIARTIYLNLRHIY